jgi:integrase/recombinase XerD
MDLDDVLQEYLYHCQAKNFTAKTMKNKRQEYKQLKQFLMEKRGIKELESISLHDLKAYIRGKQKAGLQPQSIVTMSKTVKAFFNWCVKEEYLQESPMDKVEMPKVPKKVISGFTPKDVQGMIDAFSFKGYLEARNKAIIAMMADCGLRSIEIRTLKTFNVRESSILVNGKGNKERFVSISPVLKKILIKYERLKKQYFKDKIMKSHNYFLSYVGDEISHVGLYNIVRLAGERAKVTGKRISPHTLRHFFSVQTLQSGKIDIHSLSTLLGHADLSTTQQYLSSMSNQDLLDKAVASSPLMNLKK